MDLNRIQVTPDQLDEAEKNIEDVFTYHAWDQGQIQQGNAVRFALQKAFLVILQNVPPSPDRSTALRKLREARMDANSAITHNGRY